MRPPPPSGPVSSRVFVQLSDTKIALIKAVFHHFARIRRLKANELCPRRKGKRKTPSERMSRIYQGVERFMTNTGGIFSFPETDPLLFAPIFGATNKRVNMFDTSSPKELAELFDNFSVPMFAADRRAPGEGFKLVCINHALEKTSGFSYGDCQGADIYDLLPESEATEVSRKYALCADNRCDVRYREKLTMTNQILEWDTSLQFVKLPDGSERIVGTAFQIVKSRSDTLKTLAFDDIQYFSSIADLHLQNLISMFETAASEEIFNGNNLQRINKLTGVCRAVQRSVDDIKEVVRQTREAETRKTETTLLTNTADPSDLLQEIGGSTLKALYEFSLKDNELQH